MKSRSRATVLSLFSVSGFRRLAASAATVFGLLVATQSRAEAQERPAKRLASIVGVAVEEYAKAIDANGRLIEA